MTTQSSEKIKILRKKKNLTQEQLAENLGVSRQTIFAIESGRSEPSLPLAIKLCNLLDSAIEEMFDEFFNFHSLPEYKLTDFGKEVNKMDRGLMPWSPLSELTDLHREIDRFFEDSVSMPKAQHSLGALNIKDKGSEYEIHVNAPGFTEEEIDVEVSDNTLTVKGEKKREEEKKDEKEGWMRREFSHQNFERSISFASPVRPETTNAKLKHGVLEITVPKVEPVKPKVTKIKVVK